MTESPPTKQKFLVVSYDNDQQQWFYDFVVANTGEEAEGKVNTLRSYVIASDAVPLSELKGFVETLESKTFDQVQAGWQRWSEDHSDQLEVCRRTRA